MNIFFIFPSIKLDKTVNHGAASLFGVIKEKGAQVDLYHPDKFDLDEMIKQFTKKEYSLCLISTVTNQWPYAYKYINAIREISDVFIIVGGHHPTQCPNILKECPEIDAICIGEGDLALGKFLDKYSKQEEVYSIKNMHFRKRNSSEIIINEMGELIGDLDTLPYPDYSIYSKRSVLNYPALMFSRGRPFTCTYCCNHSIRKMNAKKGRYVRFKSIDRAIQEIQKFLKVFDVSVLNYDDDTFTKNKEWLFAFLKEYKKEINIPFNCNARPETLNDEVCKALKDANCRSVSMGVESGNENIRKHILKRTMTNESLIEAFAMLKRHGIITSSFNMVGIPEETYEEYLDTVKLNRTILPDQMQISIYYPYPGTELANYAIEKGYLPSKEVFSHSYFSESILDMKKFPKWKIKIAYTMFHFNVFKEQSFIKAVYYLLRYNLLKNIFIKKILKVVLFR